MGLELLLCVEAGEAGVCLARGHCVWILMAWSLAAVGAPRLRRFHSCQVWWTHGGKGSEFGRLWSLYLLEPLAVSGLDLSLSGGRDLSALHVCHCVGVGIMRGSPLGGFLL